MIMSSSFSRLSFVQPKNPANGFNLKDIKEVGKNERSSFERVLGDNMSSKDEATISGLKKDETLPPPIGLNNSGTNCFFNASLQCLLSCPKFITFITHLTDFLPSKPNTTDFLDLLAKHIQTLKFSRNSKTLDVSQMLLMLKKHSRGTISLNRQEDSHELLCVFLDLMEKCCLRRLNLPATTRVDGISESTMIHKIFGGQLVETTSCPNCGFRSSKKESFLQLSLVLDSSKKASVHQLLHKMTETERLDIKNLWECEKCKNKVQAERRTEVSKEPDTLIVHLKRFGISFQNGLMKRTKLRTAVPIESEELQVELNNGEKIEYYLVGVLVHKGESVHSGHYFSYVKCDEFGAR